MSVFQAKDLKSYLKRYIASLPKNGRGEVTRLSRALRVSSTLISQVLSGAKTLTPEQAQLLIGYLGLSGLDADYITFLIQHERAGSEELRRFWKTKLDETRERSLKLATRVTTDRVLSDQERAVFYSSPMYSAIRLFCSVGETGKSLNEICERFELPRARAAEMIKFLVETGLCAERKERFVMGAQKTHLEQGSPHLLRHHSNWRIRAILQSESLNEKELMYTAPVSLSKTDFDHLREEMVGFIKKFLSTVHASPAEEIACFNLDFFWIKK